MHNLGFLVERSLLNNSTAIDTENEANLASEKLTLIQTIVGVVLISIYAAGLVATAFFSFYIEVKTSKSGNQIDRLPDELPQKISKEQSNSKKGANYTELRTKEYLEISSPTEADSDTAKSNDDVTVTTTNKKGQEETKDKTESDAVLISKQATSIAAVSAVDDETAPPSEADAKTERGIEICQQGVPPQKIGCYKLVKNIIKRIKKYRSIYLTVIIHFSGEYTLFFGFFDFLSPSGRH